MTDLTSHPHPERSKAPTARRGLKAVNLRQRESSRSQLLKMALVQGILIYFHSPFPTEGADSS